jgi:hypothetical protein
MYRRTRGVGKDKDSSQLGPGSALVERALADIERTIENGNTFKAPVKGKDLLILELLEHGSSVPFWVHDFTPWSDPRFHVMDITARFWRLTTQSARELYPRLARAAAR